MTVTPRQALRRVQRVVALQWRGIAIVLIIITDVIFFSVVFVLMDSSQLSVADDPKKSRSWQACLMTVFGEEGSQNKDDCLEEAKGMVLSQATVSAVLILLSVSFQFRHDLTHTNIDQTNGIWLLLLMTRTSMFTGWVQLFKSPFRPGGREFISADASKPYSKDPSSYEMLASGRNGDFSMAKPDVPLTPLSPAAYHAPTRSGSQTPDYFGREARYQNPTQSFSSPRPPQGRDWNPAATQAPPYQQSHRVDPLAMNKI